MSRKQPDELRSLFEEAPISRITGQRLLACGHGAAEVLLPFCSDFSQGKGVVHGGIVTLIADTAGYFAAASLGYSHLATAQLSVNLLAPARAEDLVAMGRVLSAGKRLVVCELQVIAGASSACIAAGLGTYARLR